MAPYVSVIIPTFNRLNLLKETLDSVRTQTFRDFEIIVVDDGSTDGTAEWLKTQEGLLAISQTNSGIATSRNNGAAVAEGTWLAFLDHDDLWAPDKLAVQAEFAKENPEVALVAARHVRLGKSYHNPSRPNWQKGDLFVDAYSRSFIHTSSVMIRKDVFQAIGGFPPQYRFADEFDVWLKISRDYSIAYVDKPLVFIRFYESNTSHNRVGVRTDTYDILLKHYDPDRIPRQLFLRTLSDHDISFGRAYLSAGNPGEALKWFRQSIQRTPLRPRSWRYYLRYRIVAALGRKGGSGQKGGIASEEMSIKLNPGAAILPQGFITSAIMEHERLLSSGGSTVRKNAPESAVTLVALPGFPTVCVKQLRWRGWGHALKGLLRPTRGVRTFRNGARLNQLGIRASTPLALVKKKRWGLVETEWIVMEVIPDALELDRFVLKKMSQGWTSREKRRAIRSFVCFMGSIHAAGVFHSDLKTCNILVSEHATGCAHGSCDAEPTFALLDYDDVTYSRGITERQRVKNLVQLFLSTPIAINAMDRMLFLREYARHAGLVDSHRRKTARSVIAAARGREILYVGFDGDRTEGWERPNR